MLSVRDLVKSFPAGRGEGVRRVLAVESVSFEVDEGELFTLLGPSGCGKTTTLRCIAGLESPDAGEIEVAGKVFFSSERRVHVPANARGLGMVFQSYAIWPHMDVFQNVAFPLQVLPRRRRPPRKQLRDQVERALEVVRLDQFASRRATDLSGGQQQRLALARALVLEPPLLLLDEPLSNLDAKLREDMRFELKRLQRELGITSVYVTHDQAEALALSSRIAVMRNGKIEQIGKPREVYERPGSRFVADFIGTSNFLDGTVNARENGVYTIETQLGELRARSDANLAVGARVTVSARPEHIALRPGSNGAGPNRWQGRVEARAFLGEFVDHVVSVGGREIRARCNSTVSIPPETDVTLIFGEETFSLIPAGD
ncbi:MAG TPA: ABC transporter ATP-binding protein [Gaiellaceae bacterium]|jgi:iron(III) transport system ATP-binding protein|nr:ABC transporter ATP-binding protein [Gaiellaceae bacterium]